MRKGGGESGPATAKWRFLLCPQRGPQEALFRNWVSPLQDKALGLRRYYLEQMYPLGCMVTLAKANIYLPSPVCGTAPVGRNSESQHLGWRLGQLQGLRQGENHHLLMCWFLNLPGRSHYGPLSRAFCICQGLQSCETPSYLKGCRAAYFFQRKKTRYLCKCQFPTPPPSLHSVEQ